ncbi:hypothetical protein As57867_006425, partial [Aphanomyces stellatus]
MVLKCAVLIVFTGVNFTGTRTLVYEPKPIHSIVRSFQVVAYDKSSRAVEMYDHPFSDSPVAQLLAGESIAHWNGSSLERIFVPQHLAVVFYAGQSFSGNKTFAFPSWRLNYATLHIGSIEVVSYHSSMAMVELYPFPNFKGPPLQFKVGDSVSNFQRAIGSIKIPPFHAIVVYNGKQYTCPSAELAQPRIQELTSKVSFQVQSFQIKSTPGPVAGYLFTNASCAGVPSMIYNPETKVFEQHTIPAKTLYLHDKQPTVDDFIQSLEVHDEFTLVIYSRVNFQGNRSFVWSSGTFSTKLTAAISITIASFVVIKKAEVVSFVRAKASLPDAI